MRCKALAAMQRLSRLLAHRFDAFVSPQDLEAVLRIWLKALRLQDKFGMSSFVLLQASYVLPRVPFHLYQAGQRAAA